MFLDKKVKDIREAKNRLAICCDLHRRLIHIEVQDIWCGGMRRSLSNLALGLAVAEQIVSLLREFKGSRR